MYIISNQVTILLASHNNSVKDNKDYYAQMSKERPWCTQGKYISGWVENKAQLSCLDAWLAYAGHAKHTSFLFPSDARRAAGNISGLLTSAEI